MNVLTKALSIRKIVFDKVAEFSQTDIMKKFKKKGNLIPIKVNSTTYEFHSYVRIAI